jgi:hypothetical protein
LRIGLYTPNDGQLGTVGGNGPARPYGLANQTSAAPGDFVQSFGGGRTADSAASATGYRPVAGRADRLAANIVGGQTFPMEDGGYGGRV